MADSSSYWSDWANNITAVSKTQPPATFTDRFGGTVAQEPQQKDTDIETYNDRNLPMWKRVGLEKPPGNQDWPPLKPLDLRLYNPNTSPRDQQPNIPIQTPQGAPQTNGQSMQTAPNSGMIGASPYANQALTGGSGMPIGGLPTQSPFPDYSSPQQVQPQQMQLEQLRMANAPRIQAFQQLMARLRQQVPTLGLS